MAAGIVGRPPPFLNEPGRPAIPWRQWHRLFETYLVAADCAAFTSQRKAALLKICLGTEAEQIAHIIESTRPAGATDVDEYKDLVQSLAARFDDSPLQRANRIQFRNLRQTEAESAIDFARRVQCVGRQCYFGSDEAAALVDQLIVGLASERTRERLLVEDPCLTLDKAIQIIQNIEVQDFLQQYRKEEIVQVADGTQQRLIQFPRSGHGFARTNRSFSPTCGRCGRTWHPLRQCPALGKTCFQCGRIGHFGNVCRTSYPAATKSASTRATRHSCPPVCNVEAPTSDENVVVINQVGQHDTPTLRGFYADALHKAPSVQMDNEKSEDNTDPLNKDPSTTVPSEADLTSTPRSTDSLDTSQPIQDSMSDDTGQNNDADFEVETSNLIQQPMMVEPSQALGSKSQEPHHTVSTAMNIAPVPAEVSMPSDISISSQAVDIKPSPSRVIPYDESNKSDTTYRSFLKHSRQLNVRRSRQRRVTEGTSCHFRGLSSFHPRHILRPLRRPLQSTLGRPPEIFQENFGQLSQFDLD